MWMKHTETQGIADLPDIPYWRGHGWEPTDERPPEPDTLRDPGVEPPTEEPEQPEDPETPSETGPFAVQPDEAGDDEEMTRG